MNVSFRNARYQGAILCLLVVLVLLSSAAFVNGQVTNQLSQADFNSIRTQYADLNLSVNVANYNVIVIAAEQLSAESLQAAVNTAAQTTQDDLIVILTDFHNNTLLLNGNPITIDIDSANFGSVTIITLSPTGSSLIVDTQEMSRAFRINNGDVALGGIEIVGQTWSFDVGKAYDGLIALRGQSVLATSNLRTMATVQAAAAPFDPTNLPLSLGHDALLWDRPEAGVRDAGDAMIAGAPHGTNASYGSEYMIGSVWVTLVLLESNGAIDANQTNWSSTQIDQVKAGIREGLDWWEDMFDKHNPGSQIQLTFTINYTHANTPFETSYEPIMRPSADESHWAGEFLVSQGYTGDYSTKQSHLANMRQFNHDQRIANDTDWAFTVLMVNSRTPENVRLNAGCFTDNKFAYAWVGGPLTVMTYDNNGWGISRMNMVLAHEVGHIFYAMDEYSGANDYDFYRGYYNTQNTNAYEGHPAPSTRVPSIMAESDLQTTAYNNLTSSPSSLETIGWRDLNGNGIIDVLDVPLTLTSTSGNHSVATNAYTFSGTSSVMTLPNLNPIWGSGGNAITLNTVDKLQYKINNGSWVTLSTAYGGTTNVAVGTTVSLAGVGNGQHTIAFRTICERTGVTSTEQSFNFTVIAAPAPANLRAVQITQSAVSLQWNPVAGATGYVLQRSIFGANDFVTIYTGTHAKHIDQNLTAGTTYQYRVQAVGSAFTAPISVTTLTANEIAAPIFLAPIIENGKVTLTWTNLGPEYIYMVLKSGQTVVSFNNFHSDAFYVDTNPSAAGAESYAILACNTTTWEISQIPATTVVWTSAQPLEITGHEVLPAGGGIRLFWDIAPGMTPGVDVFYAVFRSGVNISGTSIMTNEWTDRNPLPNNDYTLLAMYYENSSWDSTFSNVYSVAMPIQPFAFAASDTLCYDDNFVGTREHDYEWTYTDPTCTEDG
ncbi:MAG: fibronectin type III domain-containing protein, partial [Planctomycetaceae bacterium]|nr:fibronectin type III domain-containing protein [Planctomycetaceae bacterium]